jgi:hypothetical protein
MDPFRLLLTLAGVAMLANALHWSVLRVRGIRCERVTHSGWRLWAQRAGKGLLLLGAILLLTHRIPHDWLGICFLLWLTIQHTDELLLRFFVAERRRTA